jgi:hypothetical protein
MNISFTKGGEPNIGNKHFLLFPSPGIYHNLYPTSSLINYRVSKIFGVYIQWGYWWVGIQFTWQD